MSNAMIENSNKSEERRGFWKFCMDAFNWLATWSERNVEAGDDGKHIPANARMILKNHCYYI